MKERFYANLQNGTTIELCKYDYEAVRKMLTRNIERHAIMKNGDLIKTSAIFYLGTEIVHEKPTIKPAAVVEKPTTKSAAKAFTPKAAK